MFNLCSTLSSSNLSVPRGPQLYEENVHAATTSLFSKVDNDRCVIIDSNCTCDWGEGVLLRQRLTQSMTSMTHNPKYAHPGVR